MALPPGFLDDLRSRLNLSDVVGRKVVWDQRKSNPGKGDFWSPCPFHQEKTPSFHVDDRKGFYYCFGCHQKGDMITFVRETDNVSFIEAVEILAREAGVEMPAQTRDPHAAERREQHARLFDVMEQAVRLYRMALNSGPGASARDYVMGRGLTDATRTRFEIGYAPDNRNHLTGHFREKGQLDDAIACGLVIKPDDGGAPYDRFRGRLMFPIRDPRGRCIAFGGRALDPGARAKYLNSNETAIFHKSRVLYNHGPAREAAGKTGTLIVAEGYMDVIALAQAGFDHAVAPLGTAITEDQLGLMWRITDEPIIALDGDAAGLRAANRLVDLALPLLQPGKSLRFCLMPEGRDPDDLIRAEGAGAMQGALDEALPLIELFWRRETAEGALDTPERRAAFDQRLRTSLGRISDKSVRDHYAADLRDRRRALFQPPQRLANGQRPTPRRGRTAPMHPARETLASDLARKEAASLVEARIREAAILLISYSNKERIGDAEAALEAMTFVIPEHGRLRDVLMDHLADPSVPLDFGALDALKSIPGARAHPFARPGADPDRVALILTEAITRHEAQLGYELELTEARRDLGEAQDEAWSERLRQAARERSAANAKALHDDAEMHGDDRSSPFQQMLDDEAWRRGKRPPGNRDKKS